MKMKRTLLTCLTLAVCAALSLGGSLAYLTDVDSEVNVFTMGNVDIDLIENFDSETANLYPGVSITKEVSVKNVGKNNACVWYTYAVPADMDNAGALEIAFANEGEGMWIDASYAPVVKDAMINGEKYNVYTKLYDGVLTPDAETPISMKTVALSSSVDYQNGKYCVVDTVTQQVTYIDWTPQDSKLDVIVTAHAIQVDGFDSYGDDALQKAYEAYQGQWGSNNLLSVNADETVVDENNAALEEPTTPGQMNPAPADDQTEIPADKPADVNQENVTIPGEGN